MIEPRRWPSGVISPAVVQPTTVASRPYSPTAAATSAMWNCGEQNSMTNSDFTPVKESRMAFDHFLRRLAHVPRLAGPSECSDARHRGPAPPGRMLVRERHGLSSQNAADFYRCGPSALGLECGRIIDAIGFDPKSTFGARELLVNIQPEQTGHNPLVPRMIVAGKWTLTQ